MTRDAEAFLVNYPWDGNIRELKNAMKSIFSLKDGNVINLNDVRRILKHMETVESHEFLTLRENEIGYVKKVLDSHDGNIARSAKVLGISRSRLYRKLEFVNLNGYEKN